MAATFVSISTQVSSSGKVVVADAGTQASAGDAGAANVFAALLGQQLGASPASAKVAQADPAEPDVTGSDASAKKDDAAAADTLAQLQQGLIVVPLQAAVHADKPVAQVETPEVQVQSPVAQGVLAAVRNSANEVGAATSTPSERQPVAADSAAFAAVLQDTQADQTAIAALAAQGTRVAPTVVQTTPAAPAPVTGAIPQPVTSSAWGEALGDRVVWMVGQQHQGAELRLNPPSLGPLEIKLSMSDGQANLTFSSQHAPVREAIEAATPRLREMFSESGISLGSVSVNVGSFTQQQQNGSQQEARNSQGWGDTAPDNDFSSMLPTAVTSLGRNNGMVDFFA